LVTGEGKGGSTPATSGLKLSVQILQFGRILSRPKSKWVTTRL